MKYEHEVKITNTKLVIFDSIIFLRIAIFKAKAIHHDINFEIVTGKIIKRDTANHNRATKVIPAILRG